MDETPYHVATANKIIKAIWNDLSDRKGIADALDQCDDDIKAEIKTYWRDAIVKILRGTP